MAQAVLIVPAGDPQLAPTAPLSEGLRAADAGVEVRLADPPGPRLAAGNPAAPLAGREPLAMLKARCDSFGSSSSWRR